jgi:hypothetical protein
MTTKAEYIQPINTAEVKAPFITLTKASELTGLPARILRTYLFATAPAVPSNVATPIVRVILPWATVAVA